MFGFTASANAFIRHVYSFLGGAAFIFALLGIDQATRDQIIAAVHQIGDGVSSILAGLGVLVPIAAGLYARYTAQPAQQVKAVEAQGHTVVPSSVTVMNAPPSGSAGPTVLRSLAGPLAPLALLLMLAPTLGACTWTLSNGDQVVLTPQNVVPLVIDKIKQGCAHYDANKVADDALAQVALKAINNDTVNGVAKTVTEIATDACPMLDALIQSPGKAAPAAAPAAGGSG